MCNWGRFFFHITCTNVKKEPSPIAQKKEEEKVSVLKISNENFKEEVLNEEKPVLIDFYADWCGPCQMMSPIIDEIAEEKEGSLKVGKVNVDENQELAMEYGVMSIPTMVLFKGGKVENTFVGVRSRSEILEAIEKIS